MLVRGAGAAAMAVGVRRLPQAAALMAGSTGSAVWARAVSVSAWRLATEWPEHTVVSMPALSPTMETGLLARWNVSVGTEFGPGDSLAEVATDKAEIDFESQDDGVVAALLVEEGQEDIAVGSPIMVTVEDADDVAAFASYTMADALAGGADSASAAVPPEPEPQSKVEETPVTAPPPPPAAEREPLVAAPSAPTPAAAEPAPVAPAPVATPTQSGALTALLAKQRAAYEGRFGSTLLR